MQISCYPVKNLVIRQKYVYPLISRIRDLFGCKQFVFAYKNLSDFEIIDIQTFPNSDISSKSFSEHYILIHLMTTQLVTES